MKFGTIGEKFSLINEFEVHKGNNAGSQAALMLIVRYLHLGELTLIHLCNCNL